MSFVQQQAFTFRSAPLKPTPWPPGGKQNDSHSGDDGLCDECAKLNLEQSLARAFDLYEGARRGRNTRRLKVFRSDNGPAYLGHFYYVTSLGDRLSQSRPRSRIMLTPCKLCDFLRETTADPDKGRYKLLAICSSESYLFEPLKMGVRRRMERRPRG